jgi:hypothetical protein
MAMVKVARADAVLAFACLLAIPSSDRASDPAKPEGVEKKALRPWKQLFNGKNLDGWKVYPSGTGNWKVDDGILVGSGPASHLFSERGDYVNFIFRIEAKINDGGNSGQYFRTAFGPGFPKGYEAQINSTHHDPAKTGSLWGFVNVTKTSVKPDEWFTQEVTADGAHIIIKVNGQTTVDFVDQRATYEKGHFALQVHGPETVVKFRKIEVQELPPSQMKPIGSRLRIGQ